MSYTLRGRLESRFASALVPVLVAALLSAFVAEWWPIVLAALMLGVGVALDLALYHRALPYQPGWLALPLGLLELGLLMALVRVLGIDAPLAGALALFAGAWLLAQALGHGVFPLLRLSYGEDGGELGRIGLVAATAALVALAFSGGVAWGTQPPTVHLAAGVHQGPIVIDKAQTLVGEAGTVVRGGIVIRASGVTIRDVAVVGGEHGILVDGARNVRLERVAVSDVEMDGIQFRRASGVISDCRIRLHGEYTQGIDVSFAFDLAPTTVRGCTVVGGYEGIVSHFAHVDIRDNVVTGTALRAITVTEMSMGAVRENVVLDSRGVGIFCGDYSECSIEDNFVSGTSPDPESDDGTRRGFAILSHFGAKATVRDNHLVQNARDTGTFADASILHR